MAAPSKSDLLSRLDTLTAQELKRYLVQELTRKKLGLVWEADLIERDSALNANMVLPQVDESLSLFTDGSTSSGNLIIEGDNFDSLRLLKATHAGKIRVILIDPPYNTGNKDWVYNDDYVNKDDRWRHSKWLEFMCQRMTLARDLLTPDGVILICINDENRSRLELMMDEVMPGRRLGSIVWRTRQGSNADQQCFMSVDHEHILVYGNDAFSFNGFEKSYDMYGNPDGDSRGDWRASDLTLGFSYKDRPNLYYPLMDPETGIYYPANPDRVWVYASEARLKPGQTLQAKSMDEFIRLRQIIFPQEQRVVVWETLDDLLDAIDKGDVPKSNKTPILRRELPDIESWVGIPVGFGRPQFKRFKSDLRNPTQPLSSWIVPTFEEGTYEAESCLVSATNKEGASLLAQIFGSRIFNYAKPASLIQGLLAQASSPGDTILDFFAGSGTTGHAVLALNAEDGGNRKFILCSSTEATPKEPAKNLCRDVCSERIRRVMTGYGKAEGLGGDFVYLTLAKVEEADLMFDATAEHAYNLLCLRETGHARLPGDSAAWIVSTSDNAATVVCPSGNQDAVAAIKAMGVDRVVVYTDRPDTMSQLLDDAGISAETHSLNSALRFGQLARSFSSVIKEDV
ncbi:site-specific DNA-methyltransferase [Ectopseudomonas mendocina]|uniref:site-specific DNA-methyltransferase n=1 Tax=Ectopseudomonas mendocina TaxID=300 RepID=UPI0018F89BFB|nr:site-specific DNA-methyltransferase [Pseudomonas mendocina]